MSKYYPGDYYSFAPNLDIKTKNWFQRWQSRAIIAGKKTLLGKIITFKYKPPEHYFLLKQLGVTSRHSPVLDIGSGGGELIKKFASLGYTDLTGIDPYIKEDIVFNKHLRIEKKTISEVIMKYDAIMMHHSLEHMDDQEGVFNALGSMLNPEGTILIRIPVVSAALMRQYGTHVVSLDPPRHFYIHSRKSINILVEKSGFKIVHYEYDANEFSFWASEQYKNGVSLHNHPQSFLVSNIFSEAQIAEWKKKIRALNESEQSDCLALYLKKA